MAMASEENDDGLWDKYSGLVTRIESNRIVKMVPQPPLRVEYSDQRLVVSRKNLGKKGFIKKNLGRKGLARRNLESGRLSILLANKGMPYVMEKTERKRFKPEASIDLHGATKFNLRSILENSLADYIKGGIRNIIIVTGKGSGIVRQETYDFLLSASDYVISFAPVIDSTNNYGSFIVRLKKFPRV
ncbi:MAG: Smr/MutS family protein [Holosporales bacterium]|nr:Smr/MutS family protein [Holosporales bacterium]